MKKRILLPILCLIFTLVFCAPVQAAKAPLLAMPAIPIETPKFDNLISFGDSLTDSGNVFSISMGTVPDAEFYWEGRWSNGRTWAEQFALRLGIKENILLADYFNKIDVPMFENVFFNSAFGGAETGEGEPPPTMDFLTQIGTWDQLGMTIPENSLVTVWIGANDFLGEDEKSNKDFDPIENAILNIQDGLNFLIKELGATHILVNNLPDLGSTPLNNKDPETAMLARMLTEAFNTGLAELMAKMIAFNPEVTFYQMDVFALLDDVIANPGLWGFTNVTDAALMDGRSFDNAQGYVFWDDIHPTRVTHAKVADQIWGQLYMPWAADSVFFRTETNAVVGVEATAGNLEGLTNANPGATAQEGRPGNLLYGLIQTDLTVTPGALSQVVIYLDAPLPEGYSWWKYANGVWVDFAQVYVESNGLEGAQISADRTQVTLKVFDNGMYDSNPVLGEVTDPVAAGTMANQRGHDDSSSSCFIGALSLN